MARKTQWHPVFARLLRPVVESHYEVQTNVPVGDAPREADLLLLRRTRAGPLPFTGLWRHLTAWNVLEFKGPTVSPRDEDLESLIEVGLGIQRRLNEERWQQRQSAFPAEAVSFWYLANRLGRRLLAAWERRTGPLEPDGPGLWRCTVLGRLVFLVSGTQLPVEENSLPLHVVGIEPPETEQAVARFVASRPELWEQYGGWLSAFHQGAYQGVLSMARTTRRKFEPTLEPLIETMGWDWLIEKLGADRVIEKLGADRVIERLGAERVLEKLDTKTLCAALTPRRRRELKRLLEQEGE
jgi:hypothetical protein